MCLNKVAVSALLALGALSALSCGSGSVSNNNPPPGSPGSIALQQVVSGLTSPLGLESPPDSSGRLFVVEQGGTIHIIQNGALLPTPYLDISGKVFNSGESGLLGLTFHPAFAQNGKLYVYYVRSTGGQIQSVFSELTASPAANQVDPATERILLVVNQVGNFNNHKAGQLAFGPDGFLYFGLGDGGSEDDPFNNGQNTQLLLGKIMRIDVNSTSPGRQYAIPADNPFVSGGGLPEIYAVGFRNPFHFSFDHQSGRLLAGDVGQDKFEEVDIVQKGANYGWSIMEATHCFKPATGCNMTGLTLPVVEIAHPEAEAVIGGFVYHGSALKNLQGLYVFGDLNGKIWALTENPPNTFTRSTLMDASFNISSFGQDASGELYVVDISGGRVLKIVPM
jgi:glucose/arabinose dehydrogenase